MNPVSSQLAEASAASSAPLKIGVAIVTLGRPAELIESLKALEAQTVPASMTVVSTVSPQDVGEAIDYPGVRVVFGAPGCCAQRNRALNLMVGECDVVAFFDDDYIPSRFALEGILRLFTENPDVAGATGTLLADGIKGPGISHAEALALVHAHDTEKRDDYRFQRSHVGLYGCNMVFRTSMIRNERFDENLGLYGWQEDIDYANRVSKSGALVWTNAFAGVHRGVKKGRASGVKLGYSQVSNPIYLVGKGTMPRSYAFRLVVRNLSANLFKMMRPEPWIDRSGRVRGNFLAFFDLLRGRLRPERIHEVS